MHDSEMFTFILCAGIGVLFLIFGSIQADRQYRKELLRKLAECDTSDLRFWPEYGGSLEAFIEAIKRNDRDICRKHYEFTYCDKNPRKIIRINYSSQSSAGSVAISREYLNKITGIKWG